MFSNASNASNFYIKYSLDKANEDYGNPFQYARIDENSGVIETAQEKQMLCL